MVICSLAWSTAAFADVRAEEKAQVKFEGMLGRMMGIFGGKGARDGVTTTVVVKGDRKTTTTDNTEQIIDLKEEKIYDVDLRNKSYTVTTFAQLRQQMEEARRKASEQQAKESGKPADSGKQMEIDFALKNTGEKKTINGFDAHEVLMTITVREKGKTLEQSGGMVLTSNIWLAPKVPGMSDVADFDRRYAEKLASPVLLDAQQMAAAMAMYPAMQQAMTRMQAENVKMDGTPVLTVVKVESVASAEATKAAASEKKDEPAPTSIGGLGGRLGRKILSKGKDKDEAAAAAPGHATVMTLQHELLKVTPQATDAEVALPAGLKLKS
jgi:hypothetical protein